MSQFTRRGLSLALLGLAAVCSTLSAQAQSKPPLKILVGFPPGGSADVIARLVADALKDDFSPVAVDNKPGAGGGREQAQPVEQEVIDRG